MAIDTLVCQPEKALVDYCQREIDQQHGEHVSGGGGAQTSFEVLRIGEEVDIERGLQVLPCQVEQETNAEVASQGTEGTRELPHLKGIVALDPVTVMNREGILDQRPQRMPILSGAGERNLPSGSWTAG